MSEETVFDLTESLSKIESSLPGKKILHDNSIIRDASIYHLIQIDIYDKHDIIICITTSNGGRISQKFSISIDSLVDKTNEFEKYLLNEVDVFLSELIRKECE